MFFNKLEKQFKGERKNSFGLSVGLDTNLLQAHHGGRSLGLAVRNRTKAGKLNIRQQRDVVIKKARIKPVRIRRHKGWQGT